MLASPIRILFHLFNDAISYIFSPSGKQVLLNNIKGKYLPIIASRGKEKGQTVFYEEWFKKGGPMYESIMALGMLANHFQGDINRGLFSRDTQVVLWKNHVFEIMYALVQEAELRVNPFTTQYRFTTKSESREIICNNIYKMFLIAKKQFPNNITFHYTAIEFGLHSAKLSRDQEILSHTDTLIGQYSTISQASNFYSGVYDFYVKESERIHDLIDYSGCDMG